MQASRARISDKIILLAAVSHLFAKSPPASPDRP